MTLKHRSQPFGSPRPPAAAFIRFALAGVLGAAAALLIACGSTGKGLIPAASGGPLKSDIELVDQAAQEGDGNCSATEAALLKTDQDFAALPATIDSGLRNNLRQGISNLRSVALSLCTQPLAKTNTTTTQTQTTSTPSATTPTITTPTTSTPVEKTETPEVQETPGPGGGTPAPGEGQGKPPGEGAGGASPEEGENGAGGLEGGK